MTRRSKYRRSIRRAGVALKKVGRLVQYIERNEELYGQAINADNRVETQHWVYAFNRRWSRGKDAGQFEPTNELEVILAGVVPFEPKQGDFLIDPWGKNWPVDNVRIVGPDFYPILYYLRMIDG